MLTEEQKAARVNSLGSSEIAAVAGEHPFKNAHSVWLEKRGLVESQPESDATWLGNEMEPIIAKRYSLETGVHLVPGPGTCYHPEHPWASATTDFEWVDGSRIVECKWVGLRPMAHWSLDADGAPVYVALQMAWQMAIRGIGRADAAVIFGATGEFRIYEFARDNRTIAALLKLGERFWQRVLSGEMPPVDESEEARRALAAVYPMSRGRLRPAPPEAERWAARYVEADAEVGRWETEKSLAGNHLRSIIGESEGVEGPWGRATWKSGKNGTRTLRVVPRKDRAA